MHKYYKRENFKKTPKPERNPNREERAATHAYVLMTNHVHLLLTPKKAEAVSATRHGRSSNVRCFARSLMVQHQGSESNGTYLSVNTVSDGLSMPRAVLKIDSFPRECGGRS